MENKEPKTREIAASTVSDAIHELAEYISAENSTIRATFNGSSFEFHLDGCSFNITFGAKEGGAA